MESALPTSMKAGVLAEPGPVVVAILKVAEALVESAKATSLKTILRSGK